MGKIESEVHVHCTDHHCKKCGKDLMVKNWGAQILVTMIFMLPLLGLLIADTLVTKKASVALLPTFCQERTEINPNLWMIEEVKCPE
mgnify:CR=1 FL=1